METVTPDLASTYANILVVLMLTLIVENKFANNRPSRAVLAGLRTVRTIISVDAMMLIALVVFIDVDSHWILGFAAKITIVATSGVVFGTFIGMTDRLFKDSKALPDECER